MDYVYDEGGRLLGEYYNQSSAIQEYLWLYGAPILRMIDGARYSYHNEHLDTPTIMTDEYLQKSDKFIL